MLTDFVEKVLAAVGTKFLRAADAADLIAELPRMKVSHREVSRLASTNFFASSIASANSLKVFV